MEEVKRLSVRAVTLLSASIQQCHDDWERKNVSVRPLYLFKVGCVSRSEFWYACIISHKNLEACDRSAGTVGAGQDLCPV